MKQTNTDFQLKFISTVGRIKFGPQKFRTKIEICDFSVEIFGPKIIGGFEIFGQKLSKIQNFDKVRHGQLMILNVRMYVKCY